VRGRAAAALAWVLVLRGRSIDELAEFNEALTTGGNVLEGSVDRPLGVRLAFRGQLADANAVFDRLLALADQRGEHLSIGLVQLQKCEVTLRAGHVTEVATLLEDLEEVMGATPPPGDSQPAYMARLQALLAAIAGDVGATAAWGARVLAQNRDGGGPQRQWDRLEVERALGIAALLGRNVDEATSRLRYVWDHTRREGVDDPGAFPVAGDLIEALVEMGHTVEAKTVVGELQRLSTDQAHPWGLATARRGASLVALADAEHYEEDAGAGLADAANTYGELGLDFDRARTLLCLGSLQRRFKKRAAARETLLHAVEAFASCGAAGWVDRANDELSRISGRRRDAGASLTPTEQRVARLAADGLSNKQIARNLFVSIKTVEGHLTRVYAKIGVNSRAQLAHHLREGLEN
jgi:DNA-binding CsgD family transcriptional regulator